MLNKKWIMAFLLIIILITISSVSANDLSEDMLNDSDETELEIDDNEPSQDNLEIDEKLESGEGTFQELQAKISEGQQSSTHTITLDKDYCYAESDGVTVPTIVRSLTINGNGHKIDGASQSALLRVLGKIDVVLNDITFVNGNDDEVIRVDYNKYLEVNGCNFVNNSGYFGGSLFMTNITEAVFVDCGFYDNHGTYGGAICGQNYDNFNIISCQFNNNSADHSGGALYFENGMNLHIYDCDIYKSSAYYGAGIFLTTSNNFEIRSARFNTNNANFGGAILCTYYDNFYISDCSFEANQVEKTGAAVYAEYGKKAHIKENYFNNNFALNAAGVYLGNSNDGEIDKCNFDSNYVLDGGAAINLNNNVNNIRITSSNFTENYAFWGGAVYMLTGDNCQLESCYFYHNQAVSTDERGGAGGAVYLGESNGVNFKSCKFDKNYAKKFGGATSILNSKNCRFDGCTFSENFAPDCGAVIVMQSSSTFNKCSFLNNFVNVSGGGQIGAIYGGVAVDCTFSGNSQPQTYETQIMNSVRITVSQSGSNFDDKYVTATVINAHDGSAVANQVVNFNVNGKVTQVKTNSRGQATLKVNLPSKTYIATASISGSDKYVSTSTSVNVVIAKATPKLTASKKKFKLKAKTKKYTVTLKYKGTPVKNVKVTIKIKKKTFRATTNSKGKATFKLKLTKKGTFKSTVRFAGNGYYKAVSKNVKIIVK